MAIIKCPECGGNVSTRARTCPHCGCEFTSQNEIIGNPDESKSSVDGGCEIVTDREGYVHIDIAIVDRVRHWWKEDVLSKFGHIFSILSIIVAVVLWAIVAVLFFTWKGHSATARAIEFILRYPHMRNMYISGIVFLFVGLILDKYIRFICVKKWIIKNNIHETKYIATLYKSLMRIYALSTWEGKSVLLRLVAIYNTQNPGLNKTRTVVDIFLNVVLSAVLIGLSILIWSAIKDYMFYLVTGISDLIRDGVETIDFADIFFNLIKTHYIIIIIAVVVMLVAVSVSSFVTNKSNQKALEWCKNEIEKDKSKIKQ